MYSRKIGPSQAGVTVLVSVKIDFKPKLMRKGKSDHFIQIKETVRQEDVAVLSMHALSISKETNTMRQKDTDEL